MLCSSCTLNLEAYPYVIWDHELDQCCGQDIYLISLVYLAKPGVLSVICRWNCRGRTYSWNVFLSYCKTWIVMNKSNKTDWRKLWRRAENSSTSLISQSWSVTAVFPIFTTGHHEITGNQPNVYGKGCLRSWLLFWLPQRSSFFTSGNSMSTSTDVRVNSLVWTSNLISDYESSRSK